ncbi:MAG: hypothetical protein H6R10_556 [Rhodocyclaceae bacterium]|nr:hypothetical protein [Rhodocyclaceae bacterium]
MTSPTDGVLRALRELMQGHPALQVRLFALSDTEEFIAEVRRLARSAGHEFDVEEIRQAMGAGRRAWSERKLP